MSCKNHFVFILLSALVGGLDQRIAYGRVTAFWEGSTGIFYKGDSCRDLAVPNHCLECIVPTVASTSASVQTMNTTEVALSWSNGNGSNRILVLRENTAVEGTPLDSVSYVANSSFGNGDILDAEEYVVFNGNAGSASIDNLTPGTVYHYSIFEYNCNAGTEQYLTTENLTGTFVTEPENGFALSVACPENGSVDVSWNMPALGNYAGVMLVVREAATPHSVASINANTQTFDTNFSFAPTFGSTTEYTRVVYKGVDSFTTVTGLTEGVNYVFRLFAYKYDSLSNVSSWSSGTQKTKVIEQESISNLSVLPGDSSVTLGWDNPNELCFDDILVLANVVSNSIDPTGDGSTYVVDANFEGSGSLVGSSKVVYKGIGNTLTVSGLTNSTPYCFKVYVRSGTTWSLGVEMCVTPEAVTLLQPGDLAIVAVNTQYLGSGSEDEVCFVSFENIDASVPIDFTDNGYERLRSGTWGETEGVIRLRRKASASTVLAGNVICLLGKGNSDADFEVRVCGVLDDSNWEITSLNGSTSFDFNPSDQVWVLQGGNWSNPSGDQNAMYSGNFLFGWTATGWESSPGYASTSGSTFPSGFSCFSVDLNDISVSSSKVKFTSDMATPRRKREWIAEFNDTSNWNGYATNDDYEAERNFRNVCFQFPLVSGELNSQWLGVKSNNWFDCNNWGGLRVPIDTSNVYITSASNNPVIDTSFIFSNEYLEMALAKSIVISNGGSLELRSGAILEVGDSLIAKGANSFEGQIGSELRFAGGAASKLDSDQDSLVVNGTLSTLNSTSLHVMANIEVLDSLFVENGSDVVVSEGVDVTIGGMALVNGHLELQNSAGIVQTANSKDFSGTGTVSITRSQAMSNTGNNVFNHWSAPVSSAILGDGGSVNGQRNYTYRGGEDDNADYKRVYSPVNMVPGQGYSSLGNISSTFSSSVSNLNNGYNAIVVDLDALRDEDADSDNNEYYLLGNPFPSAISAYQFLEKNNGLEQEILGTIYVFSQQNSFGSYSRTGDNIAINVLGASDPGPHADTEFDAALSSDFNIASGQGFFVIKKGAYSGANQVVFENSMRQKGNDNFKTARYHNEIKGRFWLYVNTELEYKSTLIGLAEDATFGADDVYDAPKFPSNSSLDIWTEAQGAKYEIQAIPDVQKVSYRIPVGVFLPEAGNFSIRAFTGSQYAGKSVALLDAKEGTIKDIRQSETYFSAQKGLIEGRFYLIFQGAGNPNPVSVEDLASESITIKNIDNGIQVVWGSMGELKEIELYALDAKSLGLHKINPNEKEMSITTAANGAIILRFTYSDGQFRAVLWSR